MKYKKSYFFLIKDKIDNLFYLLTYFLDKLYIFIIILFSLINLK